ncbi:MAG: MFS transporter [Coriobacteriales bacterium]|jgi:MFS family permease|nr:MFS transporter [Coriobacteriales bacterium]
MQNTKKGTTAIAAGILSLFLISFGISYIQVILPGLYAHFSDLSPATVMYTMSIAPGTGILGGLICGLLVSRRLVGYRPLAILGTVMFFVGGTMPAFIHEFWAILLFRAILGWGMGSMSVLANPLITAFFEGDSQTRILSIGTATAQIGAMLMQLTAGFLADINMWYAFAADALALLSIFGAIFLLKEPSKEDLPTMKMEKGALPARVWYVAGISLLATLSLCPLLFNFSVFTLKFTDSMFLASTVQVTYTIGMIIGGFIFMFTYKFFKRRIFAVGTILLAIGIAIYITAPAFALLYVGFFIAGLGYATVLTALLKAVAVIVKPSLIAFATAIVMTALQSATFLVSPCLSLIEVFGGDVIYMPIWISIGIFIVMAVITGAASPFPKGSGAETESPVAE